MPAPGPEKGFRKPTMAQIERRRDKVVELTLAGYAVDQIVAALSIHHTTVTKDRNARRKELIDGPKLIKGPSRRPHDPEPFDWYAEPPPPPPPPGYVLSSPVPRVESLLGYLRDTNARNRFAFNIDEAEAAGDEGFIVGSQLLLADLAAYIQELQQIALHARVQEKAKLPEARDDLRQAPVKPTWKPTVARGLPEKDSGEIPGRVYQHLWAARYAGVAWNEEMAARIARTQTVPVARVLHAMDEMREAGLE